MYLFATPCARSKSVPLWWAIFLPKSKTFFLLFSLATILPHAFIFWVLKNKYLTVIGIPVPSELKKEKRLIGEIGDFF